MNGGQSTVTVNQVNDFKITPFITAACFSAVQYHFFLCTLTNVLKPYLAICWWLLYLWLWFNCSVCGGVVFICEPTIHKKQVHLNVNGVLWTEKTTSSASWGTHPGIWFGLLCINNNKKVCCHCFAWNTRSGLAQSTKMRLVWINLHLKSLFWLWFFFYFPDLFSYNKRSQENMNMSEKWTFK